MRRQLLGETFDIHGGGLDLIFPHHEGKIAPGRRSTPRQTDGQVLDAQRLDAGFERDQQLGGRHTRATQGDNVARPGKISKSKSARPI